MEYLCQDGLLCREGIPPVALQHVAQILKILNWQGLVQPQECPNLLLVSGSCLATDVGQSRIIRNDSREEKGKEARSKEH